MLKNKKTKDSLFILYCKFLLLSPFIVLLIMPLMITAEPIYLIISSIVLVLGYCSLCYLNNSISNYYDIELSRYNESTIIEKCLNIEDIDNLRLSINNIEREIIRNMLLCKLDKIEEKIIKENKENEKFNKKIKEAKEILENIIDKELKIKLQDELDLKIKIHFNKYLKNSIFVENLNL